MLVMMIYVDDGNCVVDCDDKHVVRDILPGSHLLPIFSLVILNKNVFHSFFFSRETLIMIFILGPTRKGGKSVSRYQQCMAENHSEDIFFRGENKKQCTGLLFCRIHCIVQKNTLTNCNHFSYHNTFATPNPKDCWNSKFLSSSIFWASMS